jgi:uncharacterized protein
MDCFSDISPRIGGAQWRSPGPSRRIELPVLQVGRRNHKSCRWRLTGPAAGHDLLETGRGASGRRVAGMLNNCAGGSPRRDGADRRGELHQYFAFELAKEPHEPFRFGWVVEIDPYDPGFTPRKRTALGRVKHEGATTTLTRDSRVAVYTGDDERFEYFHKFVGKHRFRRKRRHQNLRLLDEGSLYVAKLSDDGTGRVYVDLTNNTARTAPDPGNPRVPNPYGHVLELRGDGDDAGARSFRRRIFLLCGDPVIGRWGGGGAAPAWLSPTRAARPAGCPPAT